MGKRRGTLIVSFSCLSKDTEIYAALYILRKRRFKNSVHYTTYDSKANFITIPYKNTPKVFYPTFGVQTKAIFVVIISRVHTAKCLRSLLLCNILESKS